MPIWFSARRSSNELSQDVQRESSPRILPMNIRRLAPADAKPFRALRLRALQDEPTAFSSSYEEEIDYPPGVYEQWLAVEPDRGSFGAFVDDSLVGCVALIRDTKVKLRHKAMIAGLYVAPSSRRHGHARALIAAALSLADSVSELRQVN